MSKRWAATLAAVIVMLGVFTAPAAFATAPVDLGSGYVSDSTGTLSANQVNSAQKTLEQLKTDTGLDLWVVFVDEFTDPTSSEEWANRTADINGLSPQQYLLAIAVDSRQFYLSADTQGPLSESQLASIEQNNVQPQLAANNWAGAITAAADGIRAATAVPSVAPLLIGGLVIIAAIALIVIVSRRRKRKATAGSAGGGAVAAPVDLKELSRRAASALVATDDAVKTSEQELGFARAQFGDAATVEFAETLEQAQKDLSQAFSLKQQLDDEVPDTPEQTRVWNEQILQLCEHANTSLDDKAQAFDELRKLEQNAPEAFARVQDERQVVAAALEGSAAKLQVLRASYAPEALATISDNPQQAQDRIAYADEQLAIAQAAIGSGEGGEAAVGIRSAEEAIGQARLLEDAIGKLGNDLAAGEQSALALLNELDTDIATAAGIPDPDGRVASAVAATRQQVDAARAHLAGSQKRPLVTLKALEAANAQIDSVIQGVRDEQARAQRAQQMLGQVLSQAKAQVSTAEDFITARRGAVGTDARTRLAEAGATLVQAVQLQQSSPEQALALAQRSSSLADQAIQYAQRDVGAFQMPGMMGGSYGGGGGNNNGGGNILGAVLGGIVINSILGGGGGGGGGGGIFGGSSGGGGSRGGGSSRSMRTGSFGGGGTRSRRGGGRF